MTGKTPSIGDEGEAMERTEKGKKATTENPHLAGKSLARGAARKR
jgi:hypothetical protein